MPYQLKSHILCRILICALCGIKNQKWRDLIGHGKAEKLVAMKRMYSNPENWSIQLFIKYRGMVTFLRFFLLQCGENWFCGERESWNQICDQNSNKRFSWCKWCDSISVSHMWNEKNRSSWCIIVRVGIDGVGGSLKLTMNIFLPEITESQKVKDTGV